MNIAFMEIQELREILDKAYELEEVTLAWNMVSGSELYDTLEKFIELTYSELKKREEEIKP